MNPSVLMTISFYRGFGGHEVVINNLCKGLARFGYDATIGAFGYTECPPDGIAWTHLKRFNNLATSSNEKRFDIIHNHQTILNYYSLLCRTPFVFHYHGVANRLQAINLKASMILCRRHIARIIAVSNTASTYLQEKVNGLPIDTVYNGVDTNLYTTNLERPFTKGRPQLLFVGALYSTKNVIRLIDIMKVLKLKYPDVHLQIAGAGDQYHIINDYIKKCRMETSIELTGRLRPEQLALRYSSCDIYISASSIEAYALPPLEAMACGRPVALSDIYGHREIVEASNAGILFSLSDDNKIIVDKIEELYENRNYFSNHARAFALKKDWSAVCHKIANIYDFILSHR